MNACARFEEEGLAAVEAGAPLDRHFEDCPECRAERAEYERLGEAIEDGWRFQVWYHMDMDPNLDSIRGTAEFDRLHEIVRADLDAQAQQVRDMKASGELALARVPALH